MSKFTNFLYTWEGAFCFGAAVTLGYVGLYIWNENIERGIREDNYKRGLVDGAKIERSGHDLTDVRVVYDKKSMRCHFVPNYWEIREKKLENQPEEVKEEPKTDESDS